MFAVVRFLLCNRNVGEFKNQTLNQLDITTIS